MNKTLLDTSAILAYLFEEPGDDQVATLLNEGLAVISTVNYAELVSKLIDQDMPTAIVQETIANLELAIIPFSEEHAFASGALRTISKQYGLSLGDRACLATAKVENLPVWTADRAWLNIDDGIEIKSIR